MRIGIILAMLAALPAGAAEPWGLEGESILAVEGRVVDLLCELTGDCPAGCGGGKRQLGILTAEGRLLPAVKSSTNFAGATVDLLPHCGTTIQADGLVIEHPDIVMYMVQAVRRDASEPWRPAERFLETWTASHGRAEEWQRADPRVQRLIETRGKLGIPGLALP